MMNQQISEKEQQSQTSPTNFWEYCSQKTKTEIISELTNRLGTPKNELTANCLDSIARKILYYFSEEKDTRGQDISSLTGQVVEITQKKSKDGKRKGQIYYSLKLSNNSILRAQKKDLSEQNWSQIEKLAILDQNLVFKYRKWIVYKDIIDFYPSESEPVSQIQPSKI